MVTFLGESVIVTADAAGSLHAFANVCRHRGSQVVPVEPDAPPEPCAAKSLRCPYHSWTYGLDGRLLHAPHTEDVDLDTSAFGLRALRAAAWGGFLWLTEDLEAPAVVDALSPVPDRVRRYPLDTLVVGMRLTYSVAANWKVIAENYNECYHCGPVHPELSRLVPAFGRRRRRPRVGRRHPAPRGRLDVHPVRHDRPGAVPGPRRRRTGAAQGRARLPEPAAVAVGRTRRGICAAAHRG